MAQCSVVPDLGPTCLHRLSLADKELSLLSDNTLPLLYNFRSVYTNIPSCRREEVYFGIKADHIMYS